MLVALILAVIIGLAGCQKSPRSIETSYSENKEYRYEYESQVLSGLPEGAKSVAGLKLKSELVIQIPSEGKLKLQLEIPRLYKINDVVESEEPLRKMIPSEDMKEQLDEDTEEMKLHLCKPVTLSYLGGRVSDVETESDDPVWSVNIKRGVLSLLELNFNERQSLDKAIPVLESGSEPKMYRVIEPSTAGECLTRYKVTPERSDDDVPVLKVLKIRDYDRCLEKAIHSVDILGSRPCSKCDTNKTREHISAQTSVKYELLGSPDQYIIVSAKSESHYNFIPYSEEAGKLTSISKQHLTLLKDGPIHDPIDLRTPVRHERPLKVKSSEDTNTPISPEKLVLKKEETDRLIKMVEKLTDGIEELLKDKVDEESGELVLELHRVMKKLDKQSINKILDQVISKDQKPKARKVILDILPTVGTYSSVDVLLERIERSEITSISAMNSMMSLSVLPKPDVFIVKRLIEFIKSNDIDKEMSDEHVRKAAWLTLASLGDKMITVSQSLLRDIEDERKAIEEVSVDSNDKEIRRKLDEKLEQLENKKTQTRELYATEKQSIIDLVKKLQEKDDKRSKVLVVKVIANLGYEEFLPSLESILRDDESPETLRIETVLSLRHIVKKKPREVEQILLPLCLDEKEPDILRMHAIDILIHGAKSDSAIELIVESLKDRPNENVKGYLLSVLEELSKQPLICDELSSLVRNSSAAKRFASEKKSDSQSKSRVLISTSHSEKMRMGNTYKHTLMFSPTETSAHYLQMSYSTVILGKVTDVWEMKFSGQGMDSVMEGLLEKSLDTGLESVLKTILHPRNTRSSHSDPEQQIKDIKEKIGAIPILPKKLDGYISFHMFGHELMYVDPESMYGLRPEPSREPVNPAAMFESLKSHLGILENLQNVLAVQKSFVTPFLHTSIITDSGLPLTLKIDLLGMMKVEGKFSVQPSEDQSSKKSLFSKFDAVMSARPSALFVLRCDMEVDLKHIRSGISVRGKAFIDLPTSIKVNIDPVSSKIISKLIDEEKSVPMKLELNTYTVIRRMPSSSEDYPLPAERKEIVLINGTYPVVNHFETGHELFGRSMKTIIERSIRKDSSVPFTPFHGKQSVLVVYEPLSEDGLDIQIQVVKVYDERDEEHSSSWYSKLTGWFSSSDSEKSSREEDSSSSDSDERDDSSEDFLDLEKTDLSMKYLKDKFRKHTDLLESGAKAGIVIKIGERKSDKQHEFQLLTLHQRDPTNLRSSYTTEMKLRTPPQGKKIWKSVSNIQLDLPSREIEPSELFDSEYQKSLMEDINLSVSEDGKSVDSLMDLGSSYLKQAIKESKEITSKSKSHEKLESLVNYVQQKSDLDSKPLGITVQKARGVLKYVKELRKSPDHALKAEKRLEELTGMIEWAKKVNDDLVKILDETTSGEQEPEDAVMALYVCHKQGKVLSELKKTAKKLLPLIDAEDRKDIELKLKDLEKTLKETKDKQLEHSESKQSQELAKSKLEVAPADSELYSSLLDAEKKLVDILVQKGSLSDDDKSQRDLDDKESLYDDVVKDLKPLVENLDRKLSEKGSLEKAVRVKLLEVVLCKKLAVSDLEKDIRSVEKKVVKSLKTLSDNTRENTKRKLVERKEDLERLSDKISDRLLLVIETKSKISVLLPDESDIINKLFSAKLDLIKIMEDLKRKRPESIKEDHDKIKESVEKVKDISKTISEILEASEDDSKLQSLRPLNAECLIVHAKQLVVLDEIKKVIDERILKTAVSDVSSLEKCRELRTESEYVKAEVGDKLRKMRDQSIKQLQEQVPENSRSHIQPERKVVPTDILKGIHKVEVKHAEVRGLETELGATLDREVPETMKKSHLVKQKKVLYAVIDKLQSSQDELEQILEKLTQLKQHTDKETVKRVIKEVSDKAEDQLKHVKSIEKKVTEKSKTEELLYVPLQEVQRIKDSILRLKHTTKVLRSEVEGRSKRSIDSGRRESEELKRSSDKREVTGLVKISYGDVEDSEPKVISVRLIIKKSITQLMWELDQSSPLKQDKLVKSYLSDRRGRDDRTASHYREIKQKINALKHTHILVAYEDSLPSDVRMFWWIQSMGTQLWYAHHVNLYLPDQSNEKNKVEVIAERHLDDRWVDFMIKTPTETTSIGYVRTPDMLKDAPLFESSEYTSPYSTYDSTPQARCEISPYDRVKTLKGKSIEADLKSHRCSTVLSMDCSPRDSFAITSKPYPQDPEKKVIRILTKERQIELIPSTSPVSVEVDGESIPRPSDKDYVKISGQSSKHTVLIRYEDDKVEVKIPHVDLSVKSDGRKISIKVPRSFSNKLCGVCGSWDRRSPDELHGPQHIKYSNPQSYVSTYMVPEPSCDTAPILHRLGVTEIREKSRQVQPKELTLVKDEEIEGSTKTCFSIQPVKKCPSGSKPVKTEHTLVSYYCMRPTSPTTQRYLTIAKQRVLSEIRSVNKVDRSEYIDTPIECTKL